MSDGVQSALTQAYEATTYRVEAPGGCIDIRVGRRHPRLDTLLSSLAVTDWAFVTAWNPGSILLPPPQNAAAQHELEQIVLDRGWPFYEGAGIPDVAGWAPERSLWIAGIEPVAAVELARRFGQKAIVIGSVGAPAGLRFCD